MRRNGLRNEESPRHGGGIGGGTTREGRRGRGVGMREMRVCGGKGEAIGGAVSVV